MSFPRLPQELWDLIYKHRAASCIQRHFLRWHHFGHARKVGWSMARANLPDPIWRRLLPYANVRREWRLEACSWESCDAYDFRLILGEAERGEWGRKWKWETYKQ